MKNFCWFVSFLLVSFTAQAQNLANDCVNAIVVCGNENLVSNATGHGNSQEIAGCGSYEHNSLWIKINIVQAGTLGFNLIPSDPDLNVDYDFWVFGPNKDCGTSLGTPIRCNTVSPLPPPNGAGLSSNITGMDGSTLATQSGPGTGIAGSTGYVRWLDVLPGQFYYIAIDRPGGEGGFELEWIGSAMTGTGAFPTPPTANTISDYKVCSSSQQGIFDLSTIRPALNSDLVTNDITFHESYDLAFDGIEPLPNIISNSSNPQIVYAKVKSNITNCFEITSFQLVVNPIPTATMTASATTICSGDNVTISFNGTPNSKVQYRIDSGALQTATLSNTGTFSFTEAFTTNAVIKLENVKTYDNLEQVICTQFYDSTININVQSLPTIVISGPATICQNTAALVTFTGTPNAVFTYKINGGTIQNASLNATGIYELTTPNLQSNTIFEVVTVAYSTTPNCSQNSSSSIEIEVKPTPIVSISGNQSVCFNTNTSLLFTGTPNTKVFFTDGSSNLSVTLNAVGEAVFSITNVTATTTFTLQSIEYSASPLCATTLSGTFQITVINLPTASIQGTTTICEGTTTLVTFQGTPNATISFLDSEGTVRNLNLTTTGSVTFETPILLQNTTYTLTNVTLNSNCSKTLNETIAITVTNLPSATIAAATSVCYNKSTTVTITATPNSLVTYKENGVSQTILVDGTGIVQITTPNLTTNATYELVSVSTTGSLPTCIKNLGTLLVIQVTPFPTVNVNPATTTICSQNSTSIQLSSLVANTTFTWTVVQNGVSGASNSSGTTINQILQTTGNTSGTAIYTIIPKINECEGDPVTITITVQPKPDAIASSNSLAICSGASAVINLSSTFSGTSFTWVVNTSNATGASNGSGSIINQTLFANGASSGTVTYTITPLLNSCPGTPINVVVAVSAMPIVTTTASTYTICSESKTNIALSSPNGATNYSWTAVQNGVSGAINGNGTKIEDTLQTTGIVQGNVVYSITPFTNGCPGTAIQVTVFVNPIPVVTTTATQFTSCSGEPITIPLSETLSGTTFSWTVVQNGVSGASNASGNNIIQTLSTTSNNSGTATYTITPLQGTCTGIPIIIQVKVNPLPVVQIDNATICVDKNGNVIKNHVFSTGLNAAYYDFDWFFEGNLVSNASTFSANQPGTYGVVVTNTTTNCVSVLDTALVTATIPATSIEINQTELFSEIASVEVIVSGGNGVYQYQLQDGSIQSSNVFTNLESGTYTVFVTDESNCTSLSKSFTIINYPKFFTPNNDGINDFWTISGLPTDFNAQITIFDRFGKLIYDFKPQFTGWDGTFNGNPLFATDYWFVIQYTQNQVNKQFKAHFSLLR